MDPNQNPQTDPLLESQPPLQPNTMVTPMMPMSQPVDQVPQMVVPVQPASPVQMPVQEVPQQQVQVQPQAQPIGLPQQPQVLQQQTPIQYAGYAQPVPQPVADPQAMTLAAKLTIGGSNQNMPRTAKTKFIGLVMVIATVLLSVILIFGSHRVSVARQNIKDSDPFAESANERKVKAEEAVEASKPEVQDNSSGKVDVSKLYDTVLANRQQDVKASINQQINMGNGASFVVTGVDRGWQSPVDFAQPSAGKEYVKVNISIGFRGNTSYLYINDYDFKIINSAGGVIESPPFSKDDLPDNDVMTSPEYVAGDSRNGYLIYEVNQGESFSLFYEATGTNLDGDSVTMKGTVQL